MHGPQKEHRVIQRRTQTAQYWQEQFALTDKDIGFLYGLILDEAKPVLTSVLAQAMIKRAQVLAVWSGEWR